MADFAVASGAFEHAQPIPKRHTCDGEDLSPPLRWADLPAETRSLALLVDDPDAPGGVFTHWVAWGLDPGADGLAEGTRPPGEGQNDFGRVGYGGPCPPRGHGRHRYVFRFYALDQELQLHPGAGKPDLERAIAGHVLATAELAGTYER